MSVSDDIKKQRNKVKKKGFMATLSYFYDYYKIPVIIFLVVALLVFFFVRDMLASKPYGFYCIMFNVTDKTYSDLIVEDFSEFADIDLDTYTCYIDMNTTLNTENYNEYDLATQQKIAAVTAAASLDCVVADPSVFALLARSDYFYDLRDILTDEQLEEYEDYIYYVDGAVIEAIDDGTYVYEEEDDSSSTASTDEDYMTEEEIKQMLGLSSESSIVAESDFELPDKDEMEDPIPVGIVLTDSSFMESTNTYAGTVPIFGVIANTEHLDNALLFLDYMFEYSAE